MANLPTFEECDKKWVNQKTMTALERFIHGWAPNAGDGEEEFREELANVVDQIQDDAVVRCERYLHDSRQGSSCGLSQVGFECDGTNCPPRAHDHKVTI